MLVATHAQEVNMSREFYLWCLVDRYLSMGHISYTEALEYARRDVYEIPNNRDNLKLLANQCVLFVEKRTGSSPGKASGA